VHAVIRRDRVAEPVRQAELVRRISQGLAPRLGQLPGCAACAVVAGEDGSVAVVGLFADRAGAVAAARLAGTWVTTEVAALVDGAPDVLLGEATPHR